MEEEEFKRFLKRGGRSPSVVERCINHARDFEAFLRDHRKVRSIDEATDPDIEAYVEWVERSPKASAKTHLWALRHYFQYASMGEQSALVTRLRQDRIKRTPFPLKNFVEVDPKHIERLATMGIRSADEILEAGCTPEGRRRLAEESGVPPESVLEVVKLSDLARIRGIKGIRARLYHDAGVDTLEKMAAWDPEEMRAMLVEWVERTGFQGIAPLPKEALFSVEEAKRLPLIVEY